MDATSRLLRDFVECFNRGVKTGDFQPLLKLLDPDVTMRFRGGIARGPYQGREAVASGYRDEPPDDEIEFLDTKVKGGEVVVGYSWMRTPDVRAGELRMVLGDGTITSIEVNT